MLYVHRGLKAIVIAAFSITTTSCSAIYAIQMPGPSGDNNVALGMHRSQVETYLGVGASSQFQERQNTVVRYDYVDGVHAGSKARAIPYIAADIFTIFLAELIFWPIEVYAKEQTKRVGMATYDDSAELIAWIVSRVNGTRIRSLTAPMPAPAADPPPEAATDPAADPTAAPAAAP